MQYFLRRARININTRNNTARTSMVTAYVTADCRSLATNIADSGKPQLV